jgi:hypothetical protein
MWRRGGGITRGRQRTELGLAGESAGPRRVSGYIGVGTIIVISEAAPSAKFLEEVTNEAGCGACEAVEYL